MNFSGGEKVTREAVKLSGLAAFLNSSVRTIITHNFLFKYYKYTENNKLTVIKQDKTYAIYK